MKLQNSGVLLAASSIATPDEGSRVLNLLTSSADSAKVSKQINRKQWPWAGYGRGDLRTSTGDAGKMGKKQCFCGC